MASTYSDYKFELIGTGEQSGTWGNTTNTNIGTAIEQAIGGKADITLSSTSTTLTLTDTNTAQDARALYLNLTGTPGGAATLNVPAIEKAYIVRNGTNQTVTVKVTGQTGVAVPVNKTMHLYNNGTDVVNAVNNLPSGTTVNNASIVTSVTASSPLASSGGTTPNISFTGTLPVANGGTGQTTYTNGQLLIGNTTGNTLTKATLTAGSGISVTNGAGSITIASTVTGDVVGPASATDGAVALFDGTTGKLLKNGGATNANINGISYGKNDGNGIDIGNNTVVSSSGAITIGPGNTLVNAANTLHIGSGNTISGAADSISIQSGLITAANSIAVGASLSTAANSVAIGASLSSSENGVAIGVGASSFSSPRSVAIGRSATSVNGGSDSIAIGYIATIDPAHTFAITIGNQITSTGANYFTFGKSGNVVYNQFTVNNSWTQSSDARLKRNVQDDTLGLSFIMKLRPVTFQWKPSNEVPEELTNHHFEENKKDLEATMNGFIAQDVKKALDEVGADTQGIWSEQADGTQALSREMFIMPLVNAVKELKAELDAVKAELAALKG
jgi:hypothetical protein